ncbi:MAG: ABC transporter ATP-binding protein [Gluconacetobacter diazotrophicus]|nr:ABC transporter ATP-binding protein [Gluconacetobacter diazotrophicus]
MASVTLRGISKRFAAHDVLAGVDLDIADGECVVFVGPSGCGKSTLLRMIAGLEQPSGGSVGIGGRDVTHAPPAERGIAMVFQSYALYPHMSVAENMRFALRVQKVPRTEIARRIEAVSRMLRIDHLLERKPRALSGGQRQRVAIGRALVCEPEVFLLDEPLSNLDAELRGSTRVELARLHHEVGATMIYVTHDQVEAMTLADRIVVLEGGRVQQFGRPLDLYLHPANRFVAGFIGSPRMNFLPLQANGRGTPRLRSGIAIDGVAPAAATIGIRPEHLEPCGPDGATGADRVLVLDGTVRLVERLGGESVLHLDLADAEGGAVTAKLPGIVDATLGDRIRLGVRAEHLFLFDATGATLPRPAAGTA